MATRICAGVLLATFLAVGTVQAQTSADHRLEEWVFNAGGNPLDGAAPASAAHRLSVDAIGDAMQVGSSTSASHGLTVGFPWLYAPPGEVLQLMLGEGDGLRWQPEPSVGVYNLYRGAIAALDGVGYGGCSERGIVGTSTVDADLPAPGAGFFYLVTAENLLGEEGTPGSRSSGATRSIAVACP